MSYSFQHRLVSQTDADGNTTSYVYAGSQLRYVQPPGVSPGTSTYYNSVGELVNVVTPLGQQVFTYDNAGNRTGVILETFGGQSLNGRGTLASYDEAGDMVTSVDPRGNLASGINTAYETSWSYDADGNLLSETTPGPETTTYSYDAADDLTGVQGPQGRPRRTRGRGDPHRQHRRRVGDHDRHLRPFRQPVVGGQRQQTDHPARLRRGRARGRHHRAERGQVEISYHLDGDATEITDSAGNKVTREVPQPRPAHPHR